MFNPFKKKTKTNKLKIIVPLHIDPSDRSQAAQAKRDELRFEMAQANPNGFRMYKTPPTPRQLKRREMKRKWKQWTKDAIRQARIDFIEGCTKNGPPYQVCKLNALKSIEKRR